MAAPVIGTRLATLPPKGATIDRSHELASGIEICFVPAYGLVELAKGYAVTTGGLPSRGATKFGATGKALSSTSDYWSITCPDAPFLGAVSVMWVYRNYTGSAFRGIAEKFTSNSVGAPFDIFYTNAAGPQGVIAARNSSAGGSRSYNSTAVVELNTDTIGIVSLPAAVNTTDAADYWFNGVYQSALTNGTLTVAGSNAALRIGRRADNATQADGEFSIVAIWSRRINHAEAAQLYANPFCFLKS